jgi:DNA invertase Pin-like site-specific DNA recombinase
MKIETRNRVSMKKRSNVTKGNRHKASRGIYPGPAPFGYRKNVEGATEIDQVESQIVIHVFELCGAGNPCLDSITTAVLDECGIRVSEATIDAILHDCFYLGVFEWEKHWYSGIHPVFLRPGVFYEAHSILNEYEQQGLIQSGGRVRRYIPKGETMTKEPNTNNPASAPRCAIYTRCATVEGGADSIQRQRQSCRAAATRNGWIVLENHIYTDLGRSGNTLSGRAALDALLAAARTNPRPFDHLLVEEGSRLARNLSIVVKILAELNGLGVQVHLASAGLASGEATLRLRLSALTSLNDQIKHTLREP